jgi:putative transposase
MSRYIRPHIPGASVFFTVTLAQRGSDLLVRQIAALRDAVRATMAARPFGIDAWVVLPDHMHAVWTLPVGDADYAVRWGAIKSHFTRAVKRRVGFHPTDPDDVFEDDAHIECDTAGRNRGLVGWNPTLRSASKIKKGDAGIWQRRFWEHHIRDERDYRAHIRYCWMNPVKHGFVDHPKDWPYSSYHRDGEPAP